ncbi:hypothetical protein [Klebsiella pneumoniae]|uniref:hypothetical protein n=1 Tax=Klebsiella pneumoniae TaxID=573 RepID=UPI0023DB6071|nr:hypothetical protein [Klebsiella pneumoniae]MDF1984892.1 hypothetical protein [Klebsiella pneumoniae]
MSELEERIADLEGIVSDLQLSEHASRIAITILSSVVNSMSQTPGLLGKVRISRSFLPKLTR